MQPFAGLEQHTICEYPTTLQQLAVDLTSEHIVPDANGLLHVPDGPGLGIDINPAALVQYKVDIEIRVGGKTIFASPNP